MTCTCIRRLFRRPKAPRCFREFPAALKQAVLESELALLGFERSPPARVLASTRWNPDSLETYCSRCGATLCQLGTECVKCPDRRLPYVRVVRVGAYEEPLSSWVRAVKFSGWEAMGQRLGVQLARAFEEAMPQRRDMRTVIVPIPMPRLRRIVRGIDHAQVVARALATCLQMPLRQPLRQDGGVTQLARTASQRMRRKNPFTPRRLTRSLEGTTVVLVDDVLTSGKTARAAARELRQLGVKEVVLAVIAVADSPLSRDSRGRGSV